MGSAFRKIFWGYLLVFLEVHFIFIDVLPDPVGYFLIYSGVSSLVSDYPIGNRAKNWALLLMILSIPSVFISQNDMNEVQYLTAWSIYESIMGLLKIILVFYVFQLMLAISNRLAVTELNDWTRKFSTFYLVIMLGIQLFGWIGMNIPTDFLLTIVIILVIGSLVLEIMLLFLIHKYKKL
ncbi:hypothetical protein [Ornithinibacillus scapharcae]|uniref:hypothetical protein n=1 Tax=Ornithinibacillus scapharcae TaxID=1147159 RepID=UPI000225BABF|nr:hypothetical protein [Ornithinibacillus scapharcae]